MRWTRFDAWRPGCCALALSISFGGVEPANAQTPDLHLVAKKAKVPFIVDGDAALLDTTVQDIRVFEQFLTAQVQKSVHEARGLMATDPAAATTLLKASQQAVRSAADVSANVRSELDQRIQAALKDAATIRTQAEQQQIELQAREQERGERQRLTRELEVQEQKVTAILDRFEALMQEQKYAEARPLAKLAREIAPGVVPTEAMVAESLYVASYDDFVRTREAKSEGFLATLYQSEKSHIPTPDDPPIVYPSPEVWQRLTETRRKYASVDLANEGPAERRIRATLDQPAEFDFTDSPLQDVKEYIRDKHGIDVIFDNDAMDAEGVTPDSTVTVQLSGISLRSAFRIMLKQLRLTYVIENEVLYITSESEAETSLINKVYPVADLVIPIENGGGTGLGLPGALGGGGNSGFGGGGGGFGGAGAGGGGLGNFGGGGGNQFGGGNGFNGGGNPGGFF